MEIPIHGGNIYFYENEKELIDFSSNINPLGMPPGLKDGLMKDLDQLLVYPDVDYRKLKSNLAKYLKTEEEFIQVGNGAVEILDLVISLFKRLVLVNPSFAEYRLRGEVHGLDIINISLDEDFKIPMEELKSEIQEGDLVLLANPNNPSGRTISKSELLDLYKYVLEKDAYLLLDEAFFEFAQMDYDSVELFRRLDYSNIGIVRAATKFFGLPGLRLGYGVFQREIMEKLEIIQLPWTVNAFGVIASEYIFDEEYIKNSKDYIFRERSRFIEELNKIKGVKAYPSNSNFILLKLENISEDYVYKRFLEEKILVRRCSNFENLIGTHIRIAIKKKELNYRLLIALKNIMEE